jgi:hypothetical protein
MNGGKEGGNEKNTRRKSYGIVSVSHCFFLAVKKKKKNSVVVVLVVVVVTV